MKLREWLKGRTACRKRDGSGQGLKVRKKFGDHPFGWKGTWAISALARTKEGLGCVFSSEEIENSPEAKVGGVSALLRETAKGVNAGEWGAEVGIVGRRKRNDRMQVAWGSTNAYV